MKYYLKKINKKIRFYLKKIQIKMKKKTQNNKKS